MHVIDLDRIVPLHEGSGTEPPLFCVHSSSGSPYSYLGLAQCLGDCTTYGFEAPGFDGCREPVRSVPALSAEYARALRAFRPDGGCSLLGWSLGGIIALETARRLTEDGVHVPAVIMIDVSVPSIDPLPPERQIVRRYLCELLATFGSSATPDDVLAGAPADAPNAVLFAAAERSGILPPELEAGLLAERYAVFRGLVEASYGFEVTVPYHGPVTHLIATGSQSVHMRWAGKATRLTEHTIDGDHHSIWTPPALSRLAELVNDALS